jgi:hypothetical protein
VRQVDVGSGGTRGASSTPGGRSIAEDLDCSVYAPHSAKGGQAFLVQAALHLAGQAGEVAELARAADSEAKLRARALLSEPVERGQRVLMSLAIPGAIVDEPVREVRWRGRLAIETFSACFPEGSPDIDTVACLRLSIDDAPVGAARWRMPCSAIRGGAEAVPTRMIHVRRYRRVFLSYASANRAEILKRASVIKALGVEFFVDLLSLDPGERWAKRLFEEIEICDALLLFWSKEAARSKWVLKEAEYALKVRRDRGGEVPEICPIVLEVPPPVPPDWLADLHFNDVIAYVVDAERRIGTRPS